MIRLPAWDEAVQQRSEYQLDGPDGVRGAVDRFHYLYYHRADRTWAATRWLGVPVAKCPLDLWIYQELLAELRPDVIVETGTYRGGSALYFASLCDLLDHGRIYTVDVEADPDWPQHPRIEYLTGSSTSPAVLADLRARIAPHESVLVVLDSDHARDHVLAELEAYRDVVTPGSYLIVEDTNVNGHPVFPGHGPGPWEAVEEFLGRAPEFVADRERERLFLTFNPRGFLRRRDAAPSSEERAAAAAQEAGATAQPEEALPYDFHVDLTVDNTYVRCLQLVGAGQRVLELGCATGYVSRLLADQGCRVTAVDSNARAAAMAGGACERVLVADLESDDWSRELGDERFDVLLCMDVLEHLRDPARCLRRAKAHLKPGGRAIVSVPNVAHGSVRLALLEGRFEYQDLGLLDRTHLRFFTRSTVEQLFRDTGYLVTRIDRVEASILGGNVRFDPGSLPAGLLDWLELDEEARTYQLVVEAQPLAPGLHGKLHSRLAGLASENDSLRATVRDLTRPRPEGAPGDTEVIGARARVQDLLGRLAARQREASDARDHARLLLVEAGAQRARADAMEDELRRLNSFMERKEEEVTRYVASLREHLDAKDGELRILHEALAAARGCEEQLAAMRERLAAAEALDDETAG